MSHQTPTLEKIHHTLTQLRNTGSKKFPKELWDSIVGLTEIYSVEQICRHLKIQPAHLRRKMCSKGVNQLLDLDFQEITRPAKNIDSGTIVIELSSHSGLKAKIQGPLSCLNYLSSLFKE